VILSTALQLVRDRLDDPSGTKYTSDEIVRHLDEQSRVMFRKQTQATKEWHNVTLLIQMEDARQLFQDVWEWRLPTWIDRISKVFERNGQGASETTYSPYLWTGNDGVRLGAEIPKTDPMRRDGWTWEGQHTLRLWRRTTAKELLILACKVPPPLIKFKVAHAYADGSGAYLPATTDTANWLLGQTLLEEGIYGNGELQVTGTASPAATHFGDVRRVIYSQPDAIDGGTRYQALRFESNFTNTLAVGDTLESMLVVPDAHANLLVLLTVNALFVKKNNTDGQKSLVADLAREWTDFISFATMTRDTSGPHFVVSSTRRSLSGNPDQWPAFGRYLFP